MSPTSGTDLCRVTIVAPRRRIDVSLPADIPLAQMMPTLLRVSGPDLANAGLAHSGWVLQRLDGPPFDIGRTLSQQQIKDGEVLYFRPRMAQLPEMAFDDVADVVATGVNERADRWRPGTTRRFGLGTAVAALVFGLAPILMHGPPWRVPAIAASTVALIFVILASVLSRAIGDSVAGMAIGYAALPYAFAGGLLAPARADLHLAHVGAPHLLTAFAGATMVAVLAGFGVSDGVPGFIGVSLAAFVGTIGAGFALAFPGLSPAGIAAVAVALVLALSALVPTLSFRLARVPLPPIPTNAEELRGETTSIDGKRLLARTSVADRFATGLVAGIALAAAGALLFLALDPGWPGPVMAAVVSLSMLLRARIFRGRVQRSWLLVVALSGLGLLLLTLSSRSSPVGALALLLPATLGVAAIALTTALWLPEHRLTPFWGRAGDIIDMLVVVSLIPLALAVLHVYGKIRGLAG